MIISHSLKYVYVAIGRTGSKSMNRWLMDHYEGEWYGTHHQWQVPAEAKDYLAFTVVRNPYERWVSSWFHIPWVDPPADLPKPVGQFGQEMRRLLRLKAGQPDSGDADGPPAPMNQKEYVEKARISLVLYFEGLPECLTALPFVDEATMPAFPHIEEAGRRPAGDFFDLFTSGDEQLVWAYAAEDFGTFGYRRFDCGGPSSSHRWFRSTEGIEGISQASLPGQ